MEKYLSSTTVLLFFLGIISQCFALLISYSDLIGSIQKIIAHKTVEAIYAIDKLMESRNNELKKGEKGFAEIESFIIDDINKVESKIWLGEASTRSDYAQRAKKNGLTKIHLRSEGKSDSTLRATPPNKRRFRVFINEIWQNNKPYRFHVSEREVLKHFEKKLKFHLFLTSAFIFIVGVCIQIYAFYSQDSITSDS